MSEDQTPPESLLPYDSWMEAALRTVVLRALSYVATNGLPGEHHFYITFRTDHPGVVIPSRLRTQHPHEMTIVLQHQFRDLQVDEPARLFSVGLSFGGIPSTLVVPFNAVTGFADPYVRYGLQLHPVDMEPIAEDEDLEEEEPLESAPDAEPAKTEESQVVSLDAFRRRTPPKE